MTALGHLFKDKALFKEALTHKSIKGAKNNERLEFLGDSVLGLAVSSMLYRRLPKAKEGDLSKLKASICSNFSLAQIARAKDLGAQIILSANEEALGGRDKDSILSDALEALLGAICLEAGFEVAAKIALSLVEEFYPVIDEGLLRDSKTRLQELCWLLFKELPSYELLSSSGQDHCKSYEMGIFIGNTLVSSAVANSKKSAEQKAATEFFDSIKSLAAAGKKGQRSEKASKKSPQLKAASSKVRSKSTNRGKNNE